MLFDQEELKEWDQCLLMLGDAKVDEQGNVYETKDDNVIYPDKDGEDREINVSLLFLVSMLFSEACANCPSYCSGMWCLNCMDE